MQKEWSYFNFGYKDGIKLANQLKYWKINIKQQWKLKHFIEKE